MEEFQYFHIVMKVVFFTEVKSMGHINNNCQTPPSNWYDAQQTENYEVILQ